MSLFRVSELTIKGVRINPVVSNGDAFPSRKATDWIGVHDFICVSFRDNFSDSF
jgi:hypothetical protein